MRDGISRMPGGGTRRALWPIWVVTAVFVVFAGVVVLMVVTRWTGVGSMGTQTFTEEQARARVDQHIQAAVDQIAPRPELEDRESGRRPKECEIGGGGTFLVEAAYRLPTIPAESNTEVFDTLHDYWKDNGYEVTNDLRDRHRARILQVRHGADDFSVSLRENVQSGLSISSGSPCIILSDRPDLTDPASGPPRD